MKHVKLFEAFSTPKPLTEDQKIWLDKCAKGGWSLNPLTGLVDVDVDFWCSEQGLTDFKGVKFGKVNGSFYCYLNDLTTLEGAPQSVDEDFRCRDNELTTLEGAPQTVGGGFFCEGNQLTSLIGAPKTVNGGFFCYRNELTTLEGAPQTVGGGFYCEGNQLTTLEGAPQSVGWDFRCRGNQLTSLEGAPKIVNGNFNCEANPISERTLASIFNLMKIFRKSYQQALEEFWPDISNDDRVLMYKDHRSLAQEEIRKYQALATVNRIKNYL